MSTRLQLALLAVLGASSHLVAQVDPGPRAGAAGAGEYYATLNASEQRFFKEALARFEEVDSVSGKLPGEEASGLGPSFNGNSCAMCHAQPAIGGSSPGLRSPQNPVPNPQVALATLHGATNKVPSFITSDGPVREARFIAASHQRNAPLDGGVHGLYTIRGRVDAPGCNIAQPDFESEVAFNNVVFRIPTPTFGLGLVESTPDATLIANLAANRTEKLRMGISGKLNTSGNDGTITRFGWKAQNKSLVVFSGEAYNVEQGVSNEVFMNERSAEPGCVFNASPEDATRVSGSTEEAMEMLPDSVFFAIFMRFLAEPQPTTATASEKNGQALFSSVGCALCHTPTLTTGASPYTGMSNATYHPFSDFAVHHMGAGLADGIVQGAAGADEFRTAPLWGVGQRLFFMHDGRTSDLLEAIEAHSSRGIDCQAAPALLRFAPGRDPLPRCGSEADRVIDAFHQLKSAEKQDLLNFLRSL